MTRRPWRPVWAVLALAMVLGLLTGCGSASSGQTGEEGTSSATTSAPTSTFPNNDPNSAAYSRAIHCTSFPTSGRELPIICRPVGLSRSQKVPLLIALHGSLSGPINMQGTSHFEQVAVQHGFVVAFLGSAAPEAHAWSASSDIPYIGSMITKITGTENIDPNRVYVSGFSAGGAETFQDACHLSSQVAAVAVVSDTMGRKIHCNNLSRPISIVIIDGTKDGTIYSGIAGVLPSSRATADRWTQFNQCGSQTTTQHISVVTETTWTHCSDGTQVGYYSVAGLGHGWPPYGPGAPKDYPTSQRIWSFLSRFSKGPTSLSSAAAAVGSLSSHRSGKTRKILAAVRSNEPLKVGVIARGPHGARLSKTFKVRSGRHQITLTVPARLRGGRYTLQFTLDDMYKRHRTQTGHVNVGNLPKPKPHKKHKKH